MNVTVHPDKISWEKPGVAASSGFFISGACGAAIHRLVLRVQPKSKTIAAPDLCNIITRAAKIQGRDIAGADIDLGTNIDTIDALKAPYVRHGARHHSIWVWMAEDSGEMPVFVSQ